MLNKTAPTSKTPAFAAVRKTPPAGRPASAPGGPALRPAVTARRPVTHAGTVTGSVKRPVTSAPLRTSTSSSIRTSATAPVRRTPAASQHHAGIGVPHHLATVPPRRISHGAAPHHALQGTTRHHVVPGASGHHTTHITQQGHPGHLHHKKHPGHVTGWTHHGKHTHVHTPGAGPHHGRHHRLTHVVPGGQPAHHVHRAPGGPVQYIHTTTGQPVPYPVPGQSTTYTQSIPGQAAPAVMTAAVPAAVRGGTCSPGQTAGKACHTCGTSVRGCTTLSRFAFNSAELKAAHKVQLQALAEKIIQQNSNAVIATGHTDHSGTEDYNEALGARRASAVVKELKKQMAILKPGSEQKLFFRINSKGETRPVSQTDAAANRRVSVCVRKGTFSR